MAVTFNLIKRMHFYIVLFFSLASAPVVALEAGASKILQHGSQWTVNIDGFEYRIQLYGKEQDVGKSGSLRRGIGGKYGKGLLNLKWRGRLATVDMNVPVSNGRQAKCTGVPARNLTFVTGKCDTGAPFVMTPGGNSGNDTYALKTCERSKQVLKSNHNKTSSTLTRCQKSLRAAYQERDAPAPKRRLDARDIAENARRQLPYRGGAGCDKCDSAPELNVPQNPKRNTLESQWLANLLSAQNSAIRDLFGAAGQGQVGTQERNICQGKQKCFALFRQNVITAAAQSLGGAQ